jgi:hypothetical protein
VKLKWCSGIGVGGGLKRKLEEHGEETVMKHSDTKRAHRSMQMEFDNPMAITFIEQIQTGDNETKQLFTSFIQEYSSQIINHVHEVSSSGIAELNVKGISAMLIPTPGNQIMIRLILLCSMLNNAIIFVFVFHSDHEQLLLDRLGGRQLLKQYKVRMLNVNSAEDDISVWNLSDVQLNDQTNTNDNWLDIMSNTSNVKWKQMTARTWIHEGQGNYSFDDMSVSLIQQQVKKIVHELQSEDKTGIVKTLLVLSYDDCFTQSDLFLFIQPRI